MTFLTFRPNLSLRRSRAKSLSRFPFCKRSSACCRRRFLLCRWKLCCSLETLHVFMKFLLLCVASCSWSLLIISLSLSTSQQQSLQTENEERMSPFEKVRNANPCLLCKSKEGPSRILVQTFHRPLKQILRSVNELDSPSAPSDLRVHLAILKVILTQLLNTLSIPVSSKSSSKGRETEVTHKLNLTNFGNFLNYNNNNNNNGNGGNDGNDNNNKLTQKACRDQFLGSKVGYPRYKKGFVIRNCTPPDLANFISIVMWNVDYSKDLLKYWTKSKIPLYLISNKKWHVADIPLNVYVPSLNLSITDIIKIVLSNISTPYVLLAPNLHSLRDDINFNRLLYVIEETNVIAVGGSVKSESDGHWKTGCLIYKEEDGLLALKRGYLSSAFECQYCYFTEGPILLKKKWLFKSSWLSKPLPEAMLMPFLFFEIADMNKREQQILVCPDVLFRYHSSTPTWDSENTKLAFLENKFHLHSLWDTLARMRNLTLIYLPSGFRLSYPCYFLNISKNEDKIKTNIISKIRFRNKTGMKACLETELEDMLLSIIKSCDTVMIKCYLGKNSVKDLIQFGDSVRLYAKLQELESSLEVEMNLNENLDILRLQRQLKIQGINSVTKGRNSLYINGYFWKLHLITSFSRNYNNIFRFQVLDNLWMNGRFSSDLKFDNLKIEDKNDVISDSKNIKKSEKEKPRSSMTDLKVVTNFYLNENLEWRFYTNTKNCF